MWAHFSGYASFDVTLSTGDKLGRYLTLRVLKFFSTRCMWNT